MESVVLHIVYNLRSTQCIGLVCSMLISTWHITAVADGKLVCFERNAQTTYEDG